MVETLLHKYLIYLIDIRQYLQKNMLKCWILTSFTSYSARTTALSRSRAFVSNILFLWKPCVLCWTFISASGVKTLWLIIFLITIPILGAWHLHLNKCLQDFLEADSQVESLGVGSATEQKWTSFQDVHLLTHLNVLYVKLLFPCLGKKANPSHAHTVYAFNYNALWWSILQF